jgi:hypothetical protein
MRRWCMLVPAVLAATAHCASFGEDPGVAADAGSDSALDSGASTCASPHALCDDFERDGPPFDKTRWSSEDGVAGHAIGASLGAVSPTRALVMRQGDGGLDRYMLAKTFAGPLSKLRCSFELYIEEGPGENAGFVFHAELYGGPVEYWIEPLLRPTADGRGTQIERTPGPWIDFVPLGARAWHRIEFEIPSLRLWYNGIEQPAPPDNVIGTFGSASLRMGIGAAGANPGWQTALDDIVCDVVR